LAGVGIIEISISALLSTTSDFFNLGSFRKMPSLESQGNGCQGNDLVSVFIVELGAIGKITRPALIGLD
jgi:hypothetical protein